MAQKWNLQDIVPPDRAKRGSPRAQQPPNHRPQTRVDMGRSAAPTPVIQRAEPAPEQDSQAYDEVDSAVERLEIADGRLSRIRRYILIACTIAIVGAIILGATIFLSGAEVTITPKTHSTSVQAVFEAKLQPALGELGYELLTLEEEGERQIAANGQETVEERASGEITIRNAFSTTPQRLIKNTRFESPSGQIYRISDSAVIPGYKKDESGDITPGSVKATVFADGVGDSYNIASVRLSVPGLKGTEQFAGVYAEVGETGIQGGFTGTRFIIDETELATTRQKLQMELRDKLLSRIATERPNGFVAYDQAITFSYDQLPASEAGEKTAIIKERARLHVPLFNETSFASFIAKSTVPEYKGEPVRLEKTDTLVFSYEHSALEDISTLNSIAFKLSGTVTIIWKFDENKLKQDLLGKPESSLPTILAGYPSIKKAQAVVRPLWKNTFPDNPDNIKVLEVVLSE